MIKHFLSTLLTLAIALPVQAQSATYYSNYYQGRKMTNGKSFSQSRHTAASNRYPLGSRVRVTNRKTGRSVVVTITDRCRCSIDLSKAAFKKIGKLKSGRINVKTGKI